MILVLAVIPHKVDALKIGNGLLHSKLIACYNLFPIESGYWWRNKIVEEGAFQLILKTGNANFGKIEKYIKENSGEEVPEVIAINPENVSAPYLRWLQTELK